MTSAIARGWADVQNLALDPLLHLAKCTIQLKQQGDNCMSGFSWRTLAGAAALLGATAGFSATSHAITFDFTVDHCSGGCGTPPFGSVTLTQNGTTVDFDVDLFGTNAFVKTGSGDDQAFKFNATGVVLGDITVNQNDPGQTLAAQTGSFSGDGTGPFSFGIACTTCGGGASNAFSTDIIFHVANATISDFTAANSSGFTFVADILGSTGNTGPVASTTAAVPGPIVGAGLPAVIAGCGGLLALGRRRRQRHA
jgi:hypothetical protein